MHIILHFLFSYIFFTGFYVHGNLHLFYYLFAIKANKLTLIYLTSPLLMDT